MNGTRRVRQLFVMVGREFRHLSRDPIALTLVLVAPVGAAIIASESLGSPINIDATVVVVGTPPPGTNLDELVDALQPTDDDDNTPLRWLTAATAEEARALVDDGKAEAALILPPPDAAGSAPVQVIVNRNAKLAAALATVGARTLASSLDAPGGDSEPLVQITRVDPGVDALTAAELYGPVIAIFFLFLTASFVACGVQEERNLGTLGRLRAVPLGVVHIAVSKVVTMLIVGIIEVYLVLMVMSVVYGANWGDPAALAVITIAITLAVGGLSMFLASIAPTEMSADNVQVIVAMGFAVLGGFLVPIQNLPDFFRPLAALTPNGVAIRTMRDIAANGKTISDILIPTLVILAFAAVLTALASYRLRRVVEA